MIVLQSVALTGGATACEIMTGMRLNNYSGITRQPLEKTGFYLTKYIASAQIQAHATALLPPVFFA